MARIIVTAVFLAVTGGGVGIAETPPGSQAVAADAAMPGGGSSSARDSESGLSRGARVAWKTLSKGELSGFVATDVRWFFHPAPYPGQDKNALNPSIVFQPEYRYEFADGKDRLAVVPFYRLDFDDEQRRHFDLRELNWLHVGSSWDLRLGVGKVYWGVAESRHLVDIINQTDLVEDVDGEDKLGQPMVKFSLLQNWGTIDLFFLPRFRERTFPGTRGRLRFALPVDTDNPEYESSLKEWHPDGAIRWSHYIGDWDIGFSHFSGTSREPLFLLRVDGAGQPGLIPRYDLINQTSLDVQVTKGSWLWKLEAMALSGYGQRFGALVAGFEYTFVGVFDTAMDVGVLGEYLYDGRDSQVPLAIPPGPLDPRLLARVASDEDKAPPTIFDNDLFGGMRLNLNDAQSTDFLAGAVIDVDTQATFVNVEASRRIRDRWRIEAEGRAFLNVLPTDLLFSFRNDDYLQIRLARYF